MILVTGATGNVGKELVQQLAHMNQPMRIFIRDAGKVAHLDAKIERAVGDFNKPETLAQAMHGVDRVFLLTSESTQQDVMALEAAKQAGVKHIIKLSTLEVKWSDLLPIGKWHLERENLIRASGLDWTILRPGQFDTNALRWAVPVKKMGVVVFPGGKGRSSPIDPQDIAAVAVCALTQPGHEGKIYELTGPELLTTYDQVQILSRVLGKRLRYINPPLFLLSIFMRRAGMEPEVVDALMILAKLAGEGRLEGHTETIEEVTGHKAHTFEQWCQDHKAIFQ